MTKVSETVAQWYKRELSQVQLTEYGIPHPFKGIGDGEKIRNARNDRANGGGDNKSNCPISTKYEGCLHTPGERHMANETTNKPEKKIRIGCVTATIWKNEVKTKGDSFKVRIVNLEKSYKDNEGNWKNTSSLKSQDVPKAILCLQKAYEYCVTVKEDDAE